MPPSLGFIGKHDLRIDDKGRLTMPARFKAVLADLYPDDENQVVVRVSMDNNLVVEPSSIYAKEMEKYDALSDLDEPTRRLKEMLAGLATVEKIDAGGRIRLSADLREIAGLDREVTLVGGNRSFTIWDRERWAETQADTLRNVKELAKQVRENNRKGD